MVLVDTCGWIEWLTDDLLSERYQPYFKDIEQLIVPTSVQYELYKWVEREKGIQLALEVIALTEQTQVIPLTTAIALSAADYAKQHKLSFADAIIYATAQFYQAELITSNDHFEGLNQVCYFNKKEN